MCRLVCLKNCKSVCVLMVDGGDGAAVEDKGHLIQNDAVLPSIGNAGNNNNWWSNNSNKKSVSSLDLDALNAQQQALLQQRQLYLL